MEDPNRGVSEYTFLGFRPFCTFCILLSATREQYFPPEMQHKCPVFCGSFIDLIQNKPLLGNGNRVKSESSSCPESVAIHSGWERGEKGTFR